jgi:hypothetical protein
MESGVPAVNQRIHWDGTYAKRADFFGVEPSEFRLRAAGFFQEASAKTVLELGCDRGRDTLLFPGRLRNPYNIRHKGSQKRIVAGVIGPSREQLTKAGVFLTVLMRAPHRACK